jgi:hypothetical protein
VLIEYELDNFPLLATGATLGALTSGYMFAVNEWTLSTIHEGRPASDSWISALSAKFMVLPMTLPLMRLSMANAEISTTCSLSGCDGVAGGAEELSGGVDVDFAKREVNVVVRREDEGVVVDRKFGRGGSGGLL